MELIEAVKTILTGAVAGFLSGLFGIGGGVILTPFIRIQLAQPAYIALGTTVPVIIPSALAGAAGYYRSGMLRTREITFAAPAAFVGAAAGAYSTRYIEAGFLMLLTALVIFVLAVRLLIERQIMVNISVRPETAALTVGLISGFFAGLLGIGGGFLLVPGFILLCGMSSQEAFGSSLVTILAASLPSVVIHHYLGHINWLIAFLLMVVVIPFSYIGSRVSVRLSSATTRRLFAIFLMIVAVYFAIYELK